MYALIMTGLTLCTGNAVDNKDMLINLCASRYNQTDAEKDNLFRQDIEWSGKTVVI